MHKCDLVLFLWVLKTPSSDLHSLVCCGDVPMFILLQYRNAEAALWALRKQRKIICSSEKHAGDLVSSTENNEGIRSPSSQDFLAASSNLLKVYCS